MLVCAICLSYNSDHSWCMPRCGHMFHDECIQTWRASCKREQNSVICPQCRKPFRKLITVFPQREESESPSPEKPPPGGGVSKSSCNDENLALLEKVSVLNACNTQIEEELFREKRAHDETKENIALKARTLSLVKSKLDEQEMLLTVKEQIISEKERELQQSRADVIKYQKERMIRSKELAETRNSLLRRTKEMRELKVSYEGLQLVLSGKRAALKEKVKEAQRLKTVVKNVKAKLTDLKLRNGHKRLRFGKSQLWKRDPLKNIGLNTPIPSRKALENLSLNRNGVSGSPLTQPLPRFDIGKFSPPPEAPRFGISRPNSASKRSFGESISMTQPSFLNTLKKRRVSTGHFGFGR